MSGVGDKRARGEMSKDAGRTVDPAVEALNAKIASRIRTIRQTLAISCFNRLQAAACWHLLAPAASVVDPSAVSIAIFPEGATLAGGGTATRV